MKKPGLKLATLALAGALAIPSIAGAQASFTVKLDGAPVVSGQTGERGQSVDIGAAGCIDPNTQLPGYIGEFVSLDGDPALGYDTFQFGETLTDSAGNFDINVVIPMDGDLGTFYARWYCASTPVTDIFAEEMLWVEPLMTMEIQSAAGGTPAGRSTNGTKGYTPSAASLTITVDPNSLPAVDRMGIPGAQAAKLKGKVDVAAGNLVKVNDFINWLLRRPVQTARPSTNAEYVTAAFATLTKKVPTAKVMKPYVQRLDAGQIRVQVVEDIALTAHDAAWWTRKA